MASKERLVIDIEPKLLVVISEAYVIYTVRGYQPVVDVMDRKTKREYFLFISAVSITKPLEQLRNENGGKHKGLEFWIYKEGPDRSAKYILED